MPPIFVLARLKPAGAVKWILPLGQQAAFTLETRPFLALHALVSDYQHVGESWMYAPMGRLFVVSPDKPEGLYRGFYCALSPAQQTEQRVLTVQPPLHSEGQTLYIHTLPPLTDSTMLSDTVLHPLPYQLEGSSFYAFCVFVQEDLGELRRRMEVNTKRLSGGSEPIEE